MKEEIVKEVMEKGGVDLVIDYTRKFIEAAAPVAQQAYEIGLLTLRIDALAALVPGMICLVVAPLMWRHSYKNYQAAKDYAEKANRGEAGYEKKWGSFKDGAFDHIDACWFFTKVAATTVTSMIAMFSVLNVWLWAKLISPELWLAHQAIEKLMK